MRREDRLLHRFPFSLADLGGNAPLGVCARAGSSRRPSAGLHPYFCSTPPEAYFRPDRRRREPARAEAVKADPLQGPPVDAKHRFAMTGLALTASSTAARSSCRGLLTRAGTRVRIFSSPR